MKTTEMSEACPDTSGEEYIDQFQPEHTSQNSPAVVEAMSLKISSHGTSLK